MTAATVTASYDLVVYVRRSFELDAALLSRALRELVKLFLDRGADSAHRARAGATALRWAKERGHEAVVELLRGPSSSRRGA